MDDLMKYYETSSDVTYVLDDQDQGLVFFPKNLTNHVKIFSIIKDKSLFEYHRNNLINEFLYISKMINNGNNDAIYVMSFIKSDFLSSGNIEDYSKELDKIKKHVNIAYNSLLREENLKRENFIKKIQLVSLDIRFTNFINWICQKNPNKFRAVNYQALVNSTPTRKEQPKSSSMFINNNSANIFSEPTRQSAMTAAMQSNGRPVKESLSIGTPRFDSYYTGSSSSGGGGPKNSFNNAKTKTLVKKRPIGGQGFIKWPTIVFILLMTLLISFTITVYLIK